MSKPVQPPKVPSPKAGAKAYCMTIAGNGYRDVWEVSFDGIAWTHVRKIEQSMPREARAAVQQLTTTYEIAMLEGK